VVARAVSACALFEELEIVTLERRRTHSSRVDSEAIVLIVDVRSANINVGTATNIETICVVA
jgi:hypothetical protein